MLTLTAVVRFYTELFNVQDKFDLGHLLNTFTEAIYSATEFFALGLLEFLIGNVEKLRQWPYSDSASP